MKVIRSALIALAALALVAATASGATKQRTANPQVAILLPDPVGRWATADRPFLVAALAKAGLTWSVDYAQGSPTLQMDQAKQAIADGAKVILLTNVDSRSGAAIERDADAQGVKVIDYDRLTLRGAATYYVSFDPVKVGSLQASSLVNCLKASGAYRKHPTVAELNGSPSDSNSARVKQGYDSVLRPLFSKGIFRKGPDRWVPGWSPATALVLFQQMLRSTGGKIDAVVAANDNLGGAVISTLKGKHLEPIPVTGQDATAQGIQNIFSGWQCVTVYKPTKLEADAAVRLAVSLVEGSKPVGLNAKISDGTRLVPSVIEAPIAVTKANWDLPIRDGYLKRSDVCAGSYKQFCK